MGHQRPAVLERNLPARLQELVFEVGLAVAPTDPAPVSELLSGRLEELELVHFIIKFINYSELEVKFNIIK